MYMNNDHHFHSVFLLCTCITVSEFISCAPEFIMLIEGIFATDAHFITHAGCQVTGAAQKVGK